MLAMLSAAFLAVGASQGNETKKPHIIITLFDDFGWNNIGFNNPEIKSPHLDDLAADGIKLMRHYVFKYCSPTRSSLLTGRYPLHVNQNNECNSETSLSGPDLRMTLLPAKMKQAGYRTAMTGKWHLGARTPANLPINRGFDSHLGFLKGGQDHFTQQEGTTIDIWANHTPAYGRNGVFSTLIYGPEAVRIVNDHPASEPLFMYLPFQVTHSPYEVPPQYEDPGVTNKLRRTMNAMVNIMDEAVGNLTAALKAKGMWEDTLMIFSADNGGITRGSNAGNNFPLRGQKTSSWEGGVRAVAFVAGGANALPEQLRGTRSSAYYHIADWYPTLCKLVGVEPADDAHKQEGVPSIDGIDMWPTLMTPNATTEQGPRQEIPLAFCPVHAGGTDNCAPTAEGGGWRPNGTRVLPRNGALIQGRYKLVYGSQFGYGTYTGPVYPNASSESVGWEGSSLVREDGFAADAGASIDPGCPTGCLFDILEDETELHDLAAEPAHATRLASMLERLQEIGLGVYQTNYTDNYTCISNAQMLQKYKGFLGPSCGVEPLLPPPSPSPPLPPASLVAIQSGDGRCLVPADGPKSLPAEHWAHPPVLGACGDGTVSRRWGTVAAKSDFLAYFTIGSSGVRPGAQVQFFLKVNQSKVDPGQEGCARGELFFNIDEATKGDTHQGFVLDSNCTAAVPTEAASESTRLHSTACSGKCLGAVGSAKVGLVDCTSAEADGWKLTR